VFLSQSGVCLDLCKDGDGGVASEHVVEEYDNDDEAAQNVYYVPLLWASDLVNKAKDSNRIRESFALKLLLKACL